MSVFGRKKYGLRVKFTDGKWREYWYGMNRDLRDRRHNEYLRRNDTLVVMDIDKRG